MRILFSWCFTFTETVRLIKDGLPLGGVHVLCIVFACQVRVTVGDSSLCCYVHVTVSRALINLLAHLAMRTFTVQFPTMFHFPVSPVWMFIDASLTGLFPSDDA